MIITRAPFRIPLGGGGTDLPSYYKKYGGKFVSAAIDKYMVVIVNQPIVDNLIRLKYSKSETVKNLDKIKHTLVREALKLTNIKDTIEISSIADIPAGTGMGSSGSYLVALLKALHTLKEEESSPKQLAQEACLIEIEKLNYPVGKQDQYIASYGGVTEFNISKKGIVTSKKINLSKQFLRELENSLLLFYTGITRPSHKVLNQQNRAITNSNQEVIKHLHQIKEIGIEISKSLIKNDIASFGKLIDEHWKSKQELTNNITSPKINRWYKIGKEAGALGGKLIGAGGGGFLLFCCPGNKTQLREALAKENLTEMLFQFDTEGAKIIANIK